MKLTKEARMIFNFNLGINTLCIYWYAFGRSEPIYVLIFFHVLLLTYIIVSHADTVLMVEWIERSKTMSPDDFIKTHYSCKHLVFERRLGALRLWLSKRWRGEKWP